MFIDIVIVLTRVETTVLFFNKEEGGCCGEFEGWILPVLRFSSRKSLVAFCFLGKREYTLPILGLKVSSRFILWS